MCGASIFFSVITHGKKKEELGRGCLFFSCVCDGDSLVITHKNGGGSTPSPTQKRGPFFLFFLFMETPHLLSQSQKKKEKKGDAHTGENQPDM